MIKFAFANIELSIISLYHAELRVISHTAPVELAWHSGSVLYCHATAQVSIPGGYGVFTELQVLRKGQ